MTNTASNSTYVVYRKGERIEFTSDLTSEQVYKILSTLTSSFAQDLASKFMKLSDKQYAWAVKLCEDHKTREAELNAQNYNFQGIINAVWAAHNCNLKRIKLRFWDVMITPQKNFFNSRENRGRLNVLSTKETEQGIYGPQPKYLGWITSNATSLRNQELIDMLENVAEDPFKAAKLHGMETGQCCCCGRELTNKQSISLGIGPICATKYGWIA